MGAVDQMEIWPSITDADRQEAKRLLKRYPKMRVTVQALGQKAELTEKQQHVYSSWGKIVDEINTACNLILDDEVRRIFEHRYLKGQKYRRTIDLFWSEERSERTIDRRIATGVDTIAEHLKLCGII
ncbi:hypothetical protein GNP94_22045 [Paenibacillus campinasensis]|uniref:Transcriptional regulator n=1 Tax=Paenibacillus campinasensis TaxID=66347 RepID=A0ABW9TAK3_9BACL|nr:hypothetical protein [Paenibacillus campinasensis]MUG68656.1 hypothetical protein [Paenibacillus campinasensis]